MAEQHSAALLRIADYFRNLMATKGIRVTPFSVLFDLEDDNPYRNYAYPDEGATADIDSIGALIEAFASRRRTPRLEFIPELAPSLRNALIDAGFQDEHFLPLMTRSSNASGMASLPPSNAQYKLALSDEDLKTAAGVQNAAYQAGPVTAADVDRLRRLVDRGGAVAVAELAGQPVGSGLITSPIDGVAEIAAVGVLPSVRKTGFGRGVTTFLADIASELGVDLPFLMAHDREVSLYRRIGFAEVGTMLHTSLSGPET